VKEACTWEHDIDYPGNDILKTNPGSSINCAKACYNNQNCKYWTYDMKKKDCWQKASKGGKVGLSGVSSGSKNCGWRVITDCMWEDSVDYLGNDVGMTKSENSMRCSEECYRNPSCKFWTFDTIRKNCWQKSSDGNRRGLSFTISGSKSCGTNKDNFKKGHAMMEAYKAEGWSLMKDMVNKVARFIRRNQLNKIPLGRQILLKVREYRKNKQEFYDLIDHLGRLFQYHGRYESSLIG